MRIGVPKEIKADEHRVSLTPAGVRELTRDGHEVLVETQAGWGSGFSDDQYRSFGAIILGQSSDVWSGADLVMKVKEPIAEEYPYFRPGLILFCFLHLAAAPALCEALVGAGVTAIAYETVQQPDQTLPLLTPMSEVAGRMATQIGAHFLERPYGGRGVLLGGVPGVIPGRVLILGGGIVGTNAARIALGLGARVTLIDINIGRLRQLDAQFGGRLDTLSAHEYNIRESASEADLLIGAVLIPGAKAPRLVGADIVHHMPQGSVIVDVAVDQGGSIETVDRVTTHSHPTFEKYGVIHYAVSNIPGAVPRTSTMALANVTLPYVRKIAGLGACSALRQDRALRAGLNVYANQITFRAVAEATGLPFQSPDRLLHD